jgi:hypothetical protein
MKPQHLKIIFLYLSKFLIMNTARTMKVISIVPRLPPAIDGVGDYALILARQLRSSFGVETIFLVVEAQVQWPPVIEGFEIRQLVRRSPDALVAALCQDVEYIHNVLVQYANYAYDRWGCPFWLIQGLQQWKRKFSNTKLITMFHELHNNTVGPPWKHGFWAVPQQKKVAGQLAIISDRSVTNAQRYATALSAWSGKEDILTYPVFSNIAEVPTHRSLSKREKRLVVFGQRRRSKVYTQSVDYLNQLCNVLAIEKILDIGPPLDTDIYKLIEVPIEVLGECSSEVISDILLNSWVGFLNYSTDPITKSGVFATYCAHGLVPIVHDAEIASTDKLISGNTYWNIDLQPVDSFSLHECPDIAENAHQWYQQHNLKRHSEVFYELILH